MTNDPAERSKLHIGPRLWVMILAPCGGTHPLFLCYEGKGKLDILDITF